uniref:Spectrin alpha, non-erythrocytic 1 n=1 Tax=Sinocyclocheilus rhinocerous TaxID=307959 RepID=A0A673FR61_9TELE
MDISGVKVLESAEDIQERRQQVLDRYHRFKELSSVRRQKLEDSYRFQFFRRDADELEKWIQEKLQIASDENYKDPSNLQVREKLSFLNALSKNLSGKNVLSPLFLK